MSNNVKILVSVRTDKVGSECQDTVEFERADVAGLTNNFSTLRYAARGK